MKKEFFTYRQRNEGFGGTITTMAVSQEPEIKALLGIPEYVAVCAVVPLGKPVKQLTKLKRESVAEFATLEHWDGQAFNPQADSGEFLS